MSKTNHPNAQPLRCSASNGSQDCPERTTCALFARYASDNASVRYDGRIIKVLRLPRVPGQACHYKEPLAPAALWIGGT